MPDLLLASSSRSHPGGMLEHLREAIADWAGDAEEVLFVPWARTDHAGTTTAVRGALTHAGVRVRGIEEAPDPVAAVAAATAVFVGGGNTFLLLDTLQRQGVLPVLRDRVASGATRYLGASAGTNLACPTIQTTNDMPVVWPAGGPGALGLVPFQVNAHYVDPDPDSTHQGETRLERLAEYHQHHATPVVGLREHGWLRVQDQAMAVHGTPGATRPPAILLQPDRPPRDLEAGADLVDELADGPSGGVA